MNFGIRKYPGFFCFIKIYVSNLKKWNTFVNHKFLKKQKLLYIYKMFNIIMKKEDISKSSLILVGLFYSNMNIF